MFLLTLVLNGLLVLRLDVLDTSDHCKILSGTGDRESWSRLTVEGALRDVVVLALQNLLECSDGLEKQTSKGILRQPSSCTHVLEGDKSSLNTSEDLGDGEGLRHETLSRHQLWPRMTLESADLDFTCSLDSQLVFF